MATGQAQSSDRSQITVRTNGALKTTAARVAIYAVTIAILTTLVVLCFNPGYMNADIIDQWQQAQTHRYVDWHPVVIPLMWSQFLHVYSGPQSMLVFEDVLFLAGLVLILDGAACLGITIALVMIAALFPPVFVGLGTIGKDSLEGAVLLLTVAFAWRFLQKRSRWALAGCVITALFAFCVRPNSAVALSAIMGLIFWHALARQSKRPLLAGLLVCVCLLLFIGVDRALKFEAHAVPRYEHQALPLYDLSEFSVDLNTLLIPPAYRTPNTSVDSLRRETNTRFINTLFWDSEPAALKFSYSASDAHQLTEVWLRTIVQHPLTYLKWRWRVTRSLAGLDTYVSTPFVAGGVAHLVPGLELHKSPLTLAELSFLKKVGNSMLFRVYVYLAILILALVWGAAKKRFEVVLASVAGLAYFFPYFVISINSEFRFALPSVFIAVVATARGIAELLGRSDSSPLRVTSRSEATTARVLEDVTH